jgi:hypothetical protein
LSLKGDTLFEIVIFTKRYLGGLAVTIVGRLDIGSLGVSASMMRVSASSLWVFVYFGELKHEAMI